MVASSLERLVYESTATGVTDSLLNLSVLLAQSQRNNDRDSLTGALAAHEGRYIQVLEGAPAALDNLLRRLESDPRHKDLIVLDREAISERMFGRWSMANARVTPELAQRLGVLMAEQRPSPSWLILALRNGLNAPNTPEA